MFAVNTHARRHVQLPSHRHRPRSFTISFAITNQHGLRLGLPFFSILHPLTFITLDSTNHDLYIIVHIGYLQLTCSALSDRNELSLIRLYRERKREAEYSTYNTYLFYLFYI